MRRFFVILLFLIVAQGVNFISDAQTEVSCDALISVEIDVDLEPFDYTYSCDTGTDCYHDEGFACHFLLANEMMQPCEMNDLFCRNGAFLSSSAIDIQTGVYSPIFLRSQALVDIFPQALSAFYEEDFETALVLLQDPIITASFQHPVTYLSRGLVYEMLNQPDEALREYTTALEIVPQYAFIHYVRGLLLGRIGRTTEASFETAWIEDYLTAFAPDLLSLAAPLTETYPLDMSLFRPWTKYPVMTNPSSPGGDHYFDRTQLAGTPVQIGTYDELDVMLTIDVAELHFPRASGDVLNTYVLQEMDDGSYVYRFPVYEPASDRLSLEFRDGLYWGNEIRVGGESSIEAEFILAPADYPDPRQAFGEPICEGGVISRLRPGMYVTEIGYILGFYYVETPGAAFDVNLYFDDGYRGDQTDESYPLLEVRVTNNFTCIGSELWWEVTDGLGNFGWRAENEGMEYQINPKNDLRELFYCPNALRTRFYIRAEGRVLEGLGTNNLRNEPNLEAELVGKMPEGGQFTVLDGPVCMNDMVWWQVDYNGLIGWTAEGGSETYWIEPILPW